MRRSNCGQTASLLRSFIFGRFICELTLNIGNTSNFKQRLSYCETQLSFSFTTNKNTLKHFQQETQQIHALNPKPKPYKQASNGGNRQLNEPQRVQPRSNKVRGLQTAAFLISKFSLLGEGACLDPTPWPLGERCARKSITGVTLPRHMVTRGGIFRVAMETRVKVLFRRTVRFW